MTAEILKKNFSLLKTHHPKTYEVLTGAKQSQHYVVPISQSGHPTLAHIDAKGRKKFLLSKYDPLKEAEKLIKLLRVEDHTNFIILGMGLGYQIFELLKLVPESSKLIVIENDIELCKLAFETIDFREILLHSDVNFIFPNTTSDIQTHLDDEKFNLCINGYCLIQQNALSQVNREKSNRLLSELKNFLQESSLNLKTQKAKSKIFCSNISNNFHNIITSIGINSLKASFTNIPSIICSAGPSLDKNIQLLKAKRNNFILISVATALKTLKANKITPDFVIAIDPEEITLKFFDFQNKSPGPWLVYDPVVPSPIPDFFIKKRLVYDSSNKLAQWLQKYIGENGTLGKIFSVAHAAFQFSDFIGCSPKILIGQDFAFDRNRLHSKDSYYHQSLEDKICQYQPLKLLNEKNFHKYSNNIIDRQSIYSETLFTTISLYTYANVFTDAMQANLNTDNATEGGIGIKKVANISLREAINNFCGTNISQKFNFTLNSLAPKQYDLKETAVSAQNQKNLLNSILGTLINLEENIITVSTITEDIKKDFIQKMDEVIKNLLNDKETTLLLQNYNFSGFSIWNQRTNQILKKRNAMDSKMLMDEEFKRDYDFLKVLKDSVRFNIVAFELFSKETNTV